VSSSSRFTSPRSSPLLPSPRFPTLVRFHSLPSLSSAALTVSYSPYAPLHTVTAPSAFPCQLVALLVHCGNDSHLWSLLLALRLRYHYLQHASHSLTAVPRSTSFGTSLRLLPFTPANSPHFPLRRPRLCSLPLRLLLNTSTLSSRAIRTPETVRQFSQQAPHLSFWQKLYESGEYKRWILYAVEAYGIFSIGEMIGRRHVVGYALDESLECVSTSSCVPPPFSAFSLAY
jgi:hypothetical protein